MTRRLNTILIAIGAIITLIGYFSPWIPHKAAGLALTGFEIAEWIKFAPDVQTGASLVQRADFYWPPVVVAVSLACWSAGRQKWRWHHWSLILFAGVLSLIPIPLLEDIKNLEGIKTNWPRFALTFLGLLSTSLAMIRRKIPAWFLGGTLVMVSTAGALFVSVAFSTAEPIVERLYYRLLNPGLGFYLTEGGMILLAVSGALAVASQRKRAAES